MKESQLPKINPKKQTESEKEKLSCRWLSITLDTTINNLSEVDDKLFIKMVEKVTKSTLNIKK
jgi:hypothetical protein